MSERRRDADYLSDILEALSRIINYDIVWNVIRNDLPALHHEISSLLQ